MDLGLGDDGLSWERNPVKHHADAKKLAPAFSIKSLRAKESTMHKYTDAFVEKMRELGDKKEGIELKMVRALVHKKSQDMDTKSNLVDRLGGHGHVG